MSAPDFAKRGDETYLDWLDRIISEAETLLQETERSKDGVTNWVQTYSLISEQLLRFSRVVPMASAQILYDMMDSKFANENPEDFAKAVVGRLRRFSDIIVQIHKTISKHCANVGEPSKTNIPLLN